MKHRLNVYGKRLIRERKARWLARQPQATLDRIKKVRRQRAQNHRSQIRANQQIKNAAIKIDLKPDQ